MQVSELDAAAQIGLGTLAIILSIIALALPGLTFLSIHFRNYVNISF
jgi:hypothetical protein